jgi:predicted RNase H-like nuclease (RuvC/YqgF family)
MNASEAAAWVAVIAALGSLLFQGINEWRKARKEKTEVEIALDKNPIIRQQLELGNVGEAVKHLNVVINSQAEHIKRQDDEIEELRAELAEAREQVEILRLRLAKKEGEGA